jgi:3-ketosteroid 9alpha-monooxygenase subunit B
MSMLHDRQYHPLVVAAVVDETADTRSFVLDVPPDQRDTFAYAAGQYCTFRATIDREPVVRCYSMSSSPATDDRLTTTVKRVPGGRMSNWMNDHLRPGDTIDVMAPAGLFVLHETTAPILAFAGGSGITPVMSIIRSALVATERPITLVYANRDVDSVIFADTLAQLGAASDGRLSVHHHNDSEHGFLDATQCAVFVEQHTDAHVYICGPGPYMDVVEQGLAQAGVDRSQVFIERFVVPADEHTAEEFSTTETVVVRLDRRKHVLRYQAGDTILEAARRGGLQPPFSCEAGSCATCMAHLDDGAAAMRVNNALSPEEVDEGWVLTCQALPVTSEVVVNYDA